MLRVWPLYFLIVRLSFFVLPLIPAFYVPGWSEHTYDHFWPKLGFFLLVMPNIAITLYHEMSFSSHTWSIGVEEHSIINLENRLCTFMGKISYGVYMYHPLVIVLCLYTLRQLMPYSMTLQCCFTYRVTP